MRRASSRAGPPPTPSSEAAGSPASGPSGKKDQFSFQEGPNRAEDEARRYERNTTGLLSEPAALDACCERCLDVPGLWLRHSTIVAATNHLALEARDARRTRGVPAASTGAWRPPRADLLLLFFS